MSSESISSPSEGGLADGQSYLRMLSSMGAAVGDFYLLLGHQFTASALPLNIDRGEQRQCYRNAGELALSSSKLAYCEGFARPAGLIPVHHAWCVDACGQVVDPTWAQPELASYFGIALKRDWLKAQLRRRETWGLLSEYIPREWLAEHPAAFLHEDWVPEPERLSQYLEKRTLWRGKA